MTTNEVYTRIEQAINEDRFTEALNLITEHNLPPCEFYQQFLYGITRNTAPDFHRRFERAENEYYLNQFIEDNE